MALAPAAGAPQPGTGRGTSRADAPGPLLQKANGSGHAASEKVGEDRGENGADEKQQARPPQRCADRAERLGARLLDKGHPIRTRDWRHRGDDRAALGVDGIGGLAAGSNCRLLQFLQTRRRRIVVAAQHEADVGMGDEAAGAVEHKGAAGSTDMEFSHDGPGRSSGACRALRARG